MIINFVVVTKGAERIAEVGARFTLDAMPGKQMAVDADLNAGLIDEKEAKRRRAELGDEADFFGSMDGASKFVRGDAVAGILILVINIVGGFIIGVAQHGLSAGQAADSYILLAVGDALVAQVPALLISVSAAMVVSRVGKDKDIGSQIGKQVFGSAKAMAITSGVVGALGLIPGMPTLTFVCLAAAIGGVGLILLRNTRKVVDTKTGQVTEVPAMQAAGAPAKSKNENGEEFVATVPLLVDGTTRMTESAAMCQYLAATHPDAGLDVAPTHPAYG
eukprot:gene44038-54724_t